MRKELDLFIELQPKLKEYRGEWQVGDNVYHLDDDYFGFVTYPAMSKKKYEVLWMGDGPKTHLPDDENVLWLPLTIDPADPERIARGEKPRGLLDMVVHFMKMEYFPGPEGIDSWVVKVFEKDGFGEYEAATPTEALLLCLREQWREK